VIRGVDGATSSFINIKEGATQGDALSTSPFINSKEGVTISMLAYGIGVLPLIRQLKQEFPGVKKPWYADDTGTGAHFPVLCQSFERLQEIDTSFGYYPEPDKSILIVQPSNKDTAQK
jgi:hypothetical protein